MSGVTFPTADAVDFLVIGAGAAGGVLTGFLPGGLTGRLTACPTNRPRAHRVTDENPRSVARVP